ncbi:hypothetical protein UFOVP1247_236 [uncultured Caudovirales phage]|uniref:Uncharacterized protein n=1 Tax=uncultured Caudovirales phage TaxID=2100421 RepID=A0A6J5PY66_9CAUD|nr:hypothetical protein UFOVP970_276 [uncultured Caudovirales phage]CAB4193865.1 hypothetical protein UFOVP1247_236 [uncultured Caudovirales phage]
MEMFDTHRRDILNFDNYMDLKKPGFGGPASAMPLKDGKGKLVNTKPKLAGFQHTVERDPAFSHPVYDPTYKAMTGDLVYKQEGRKAFKYDDQRTGIPVVQMDPLKEGKSYTSFNRFINEAMEDETEEEVEAELMGYEGVEDENEEDEEEERSYATKSNRTMSDLRAIEDRLRNFEDEDSEDEEDFGANPFGEVPQWIKDLQNNQADRQTGQNSLGSEEVDDEFGANPDDCDECGDTNWMK